ncbi:hypothetical protein L195_g060611, partial [Trifolium pratense]
MLCTVRGYSFKKCTITKMKMKIIRLSNSYLHLSVYAVASTTGYVSSVGLNHFCGGVGCICTATQFQSG